jgi:hypothetical protein
LQVIHQVYNLSEKEGAQHVQSADTRESRVSKRSEIRIEVEVQNREPNPEELELQARMIRKRRELEEMEEELSRMQTHDKEATRAQLTTVGVCHSLRTEAPPRKKMRTNGFGREEAVVLNSGEQLAAARARLQLRQKQGEMKKAISAAKKNLRATERALT